MNAWGRALWGALAGGLLVLALHPITQAFLREALYPNNDLSYIKSTPTLLENLVEIPRDESLMTSATWALIYANYLRNDPEFLIPRYHELFVERMLMAHEVDPDNAFWLQMKSVGHLQLGETDMALLTWNAAADRLRWNDLQGTRLNDFINGLELAQGQPLAWHYAVAYHARSKVVGQVLRDHSQQMLRIPVASREDELTLHYATILNGSHLRGGARNVQAAWQGLEIVDFAGINPRSDMFENLEMISIRAQHEARYALIGELEVSDRERESLAIKTAYSENDAWRALIRPDETVQRAKYLTTMSVVTARTPYALTTLLFVSLGFVALAWITPRWAPLGYLFSPRVAPFLGVGVGIAVFVMTRLPFVSLWATIALSCLAVTGSKTPLRPTQQLSQSFRLVLVLIALCFSSAWLAYWTGQGPVSNLLLENSDLRSHWLPGAPVYLGLSILIASLTLGASAIFALIQQSEARFLAPRALLFFGQSIVVIAVAMALVGIPIALGQDVRVGEELRMLYQNEPLVYLNLRP